MTAAERGFLLLTSHLGNPERKVLTTAQLRSLFQRMRGREAAEPDRKLWEGDLLALGYGREMASRILSLLEEQDLLDHYLKRGTRAGCTPIPRISPQYPAILRRRLGLDAPGCLWVKGDASLLQHPAIALVGSRELHVPNREFAAEVGRHAACQGLTLVSGNARGADRTAQESCLRAGGQVVSFVADELSTKPNLPNLLFVSEEDFDAPFSTPRALSRNRCIHALGRITFVAQSDLHKGGTWDGTAKNLHARWSPVACFSDGSEASQALESLGAYLIGTEEIRDFTIPLEPTFFDP